MSLRHGALAVCLVIAGCATPRYTYEPVAPVAPSPDPARACYERDRVSLAGGSVFWERHKPGYGPNTMITSYFSSGGLVVHHAGRRLDARGALRQIGEAELAREYEQILARTQTAHTMYPIYRNTTVGLVILGSAAVLGGGLWLLSDPGGSDTPAYVMLGGLAVSGVSLIPALLAYNTIDDSITHERDQRLVSAEPFVPGMVDGARRHNERVAGRCGTTADLPMTRQVRSALGI